MRATEHYPLLIFEDDHLLVVNKPAGLSTHSPSPFTGEGIYDWLRHREPRWAALAIVHRLDKETSGVLVFSKTAVANRSLTDQFTRRLIHKKYLFVTSQVIQRKETSVTSAIVRSGERYVSRPLHAGCDHAETRFRVLGSHPLGTLVEAEPLTGRTHQIRVHAADSSFPVLGDNRYGGANFPRLCLHAAEIAVTHPASGAAISFQAPVDFSCDAQLALRSAVIDFELTNAYRLIHGASDGWPGWYVDRLDDYLLSQSANDLSPQQRKALSGLLETSGTRCAYHKILTRQITASAAHTKVCSGQNTLLAEHKASPAPRPQEATPASFAVRENGVRFELSFDEGYSVGIFLDERDNRRRILTEHIAADFPLFAERPGPPRLLNAFAYTCGFSVCAAIAGAQTVSIDLSKKYLQWGRRNFELNGIDAAGHEFLHGDVFDWFRRLSKKQHSFDAIILDPPTFSRSKESGVFRAERDIGKLVTTSLPLLKSNGVLFVSTNATKLAADNFVETVTKAIKASSRRIIQKHYVPQPLDFAVTRDEPAYLKTLWLRVQ
ncbi:MAG: hypothetical protein FJ403_04365 [Verrucomicrobia bacterium]|nr:hypothetical protein [Verrucomicrobiota bacterium]